jgi:hypothetical protein
MNTLLKRTIWLFALLVGVTNFLIIMSNTDTTKGKIVLMCEIGVVAVVFACIYWRMIRKHSLWREAFMNEMPSKSDSINERKKGWWFFAIMSGCCLLIVLLDMRLIYWVAVMYGIYLLSVILKMVNHHRHRRITYE